MEFYISIQDKNGNEVLHREYSAEGLKDYYSCEAFPAVEAVASLNAYLKNMNASAARSDIPKRMDNQLAVVLDSIYKDVCKIGDRGLMPFSKSVKSESSQKAIIRIQDDGEKYTMNHCFVSYQQSIRNDLTQPLTAPAFVQADIIRTKDANLVEDWAPITVMRQLIENGDNKEFKTKLRSNRYLDCADYMAPITSLSTPGLYDPSCVDVFMKHNQLAKDYKTKIAPDETQVFLRDDGTIICAEPVDIKDVDFLHRHGIVDHTDNKHWVQLKAYDMNGHPTKLFFREYEQSLAARPLSYRKNDERLFDAVDKHLQKAGRGPKLIAFLGILRENSIEDFIKNEHSSIKYFLAEKTKKSIANIKQQVADMRKNFLPFDEVAQTYDKTKQALKKFHRN